MKKEQSIVVLLQTPEGGEIEHVLHLEVDWSEFVRNPHDREPRMYDGSEDGREIEDVKLIGHNAP